MTCVVICRVCETEATVPVIELDAPGVTSLGDFRPIGTRVVWCRRCGHLSSPDFPEADRYYDEEYDTVGPGADDLVSAKGDGHAIYRNDAQIDALFSLVDPPAHGRLLDIGCGHGLLMKRFAARRPAWSTFGFEVSDRYSAENVAIGTLPTGPFDLITAFYVFEHLADPARLLREIVVRLAPCGRVFLAVPDVWSNPADAIAIDHVSHFTRSSIDALFERCDLVTEQCTSDLVPGTWFAVGSRATVERRASRPLDRGRPARILGTTEIGNWWQHAHEALETFLEREAPLAIAIWGAGVYGAHLLMRLRLAGARVACFIDRNERKQGTRFHDLPVMAPEALPEENDGVVLALRPVEAEALDRNAPPLAGRRVFALPPWPPRAPRSRAGSTIIGSASKSSA